MENNSVFRVISGTLDSFFSFNPHLTDYCVPVVLSSQPQKTLGNERYLDLACVEAEAKESYVHCHRAGML